MMTAADPVADAASDQPAACLKSGTTHASARRTHRGVRLGPLPAAIELQGPLDREALAVDDADWARAWRLGTPGGTRCGQSTGRRCRRRGDDLAGRHGLQRFRARCGTGRGRRPRPTTRPSTVQTRIRYQSVGVPSQHLVYQRPSNFKGPWTGKRWPSMTRIGRAPGGLGPLAGRGAANRLVDGAAGVVTTWPVGTASSASVLDAVLGEAAGRVQRLGPAPFKPVSVTRAYASRVSTSSL